MFRLFERAEEEHTHTKGMRESQHYNCEILFRSNSWFVSVFRGFLQPPASVAQGEDPHPSPQVSRHTGKQDYEGAEHTAWPKRTSKVPMVAKR